MVSRLAVALITLILAASNASAQFSCGDTIGPGAKVTFTADVGTCAAATTNPALRIVGPATVDMAGFSVLCDDTDKPQGIVVEGKGVKLMNGGVRNCQTCVRLGGEGKHAVTAMAVEGCGSEGVNAVSDKNKIRRVSANNVGDDGFDIEGEKNKLEDVVAVDSGDHGFEIDGNQNKFVRATAAENGNDGFRLNGHGNAVKDCVGIANDDQGADVEGDTNKMKKCTFTRNRNGGSEVDGDNNSLTKLLFLDNDADGLKANNGAGNNVFANNVAVGHEGVDLSDANAGGTCDGNQWKKNVFGTSDANGTPDPACIK